MWTEPPTDEELEKAPEPEKREPNEKTRASIFDGFREAMEERNKVHEQEMRATALEEAVRYFSAREPATIDRVLHAANRFAQFIRDGAPHERGGIEDLRGGGTVI